MRLNKDEIAGIEGLLSMRLKGMTLGQIASAVKATSHSEVAHTFRILRLVGVDVPDGQVRGPDKKPRKRRSITTSAARTFAAQTTAPRRTFLTAEQWQERLSASGF